ncbi:hypothetical protein [Actinoplanes sp. HUAS TT8]|uniref:hypothetical protein n=1 Tax=Actinoplanes sp. HUAS TT8 TaxID=3447453 RepID=UPI003F526A19
MIAIVILLWLTALAVGVWAVWPSSSPKPEAATAETMRKPGPDSLEGVLVAQLLSSEITPAQYRRAIEGLAARDEQRHPMSVPGDEA